VALPTFSPIIIDTGPLVALIDKADPAHLPSAAIFRLLTAPPITTWPCLTEAFYLAGRLCGWRGQQQLLTLLVRGAVQIHTTPTGTIHRINALMTQYQDRPMDFADASLVVLAETIQTKRVFTLDDDFYFYRVYDRDNFEVIRPEVF
jgi:uncharacterized protein